MSLGLTQRRPNFPGYVAKLINRIKRAGRSGRLAKEVQIYDRSDSKKSIKHHEVYERQDDGTWTKVHEHTDERPAKRRPTDKEGR
jgi:hypothetical protein